MTPRATYRLQFAADFRFADAAALAPYLAALGISHVYASPVFASRPGSAHGYDVVDPNRLNPELGDEAAFRAMAARLREHGLGLVLDIVPNHMGIGGAANGFWLDVLRWGPASPYANWFDIDWRSGFPGLGGKVLVPFLGDQYGATLAAGGLELRFDPDDGFAVWAHDSHKLPIRPADYGRVMPDLAADYGAPDFGAAEPESWPALRPRLAELRTDAVAAALTRYRGREGDLASWARLDALIGDQHWRAAKFNLDADAINYRRFFTISDLAGLRAEDPAVFDATHRLVLALLDEGLVDGLRIDHIDGLRDPKGYCLRLRERAARPFWLLVEKILAPDERLPRDWGADGATGYEVANLLVLLLTDPAGEEVLTRTYAESTGRAEAPREVVRAGKIEVLAGPMAAEAEAVLRRLRQIAADDARTRDLGPGALRAALAEYVAALDVYRTYADAEGVSPADRARIKAAMAAARARRPEVEPLAFDLLERVLGADPPDEAALRVQQLSGPVMAKGLEDKALYRFNRLIALNEVGSEPGRFGLDLAEFHAANAERQAREPLAMIATSTHDTKRGEDARLRIAALAGRAQAWRAAVAGWPRLLPEAAGVDPNEAYFFFQLLLGAWPADWRPSAEIARADLAAFAGRVRAALAKSAREAGVNTRWVFGDAAYEARLAALVDAALDPEGRFLPAFRAFEAGIAADGRHLGLVQTALKLTIPGVPDIYRGAEFWEQSLVDPDNRRAVDFPARAGALARATRFAAVDPDGADAKLALTAALLALRRDRPDLFARGSYAPLAAEGPGAGEVCAFVRENSGAAMLVAVRLRPARMPRDTRIPIPAGEWSSVLDPGLQAEPEAAALFSRNPVAVFIRDR